MDDLVRCVQQFRSALANLVGGIPRFSFRRPNDLSVRFGIDAKLAWTIGKCIEEDDPFLTAKLIPGPTGLKNFLDAVERANIDYALVDAVRKSFSEFETLVKQYARNRKSFNTFVAGLSASPANTSDVEHRRLAFEGARYIWGVQARTIFRCTIATPSQDPERWDLGAVRGYVDFNLLRPNVAWRITPPQTFDDQGVFHFDVKREPVDPHSHKSGVDLPLMLDFCTPTIPQFREITGAFGNRELEFLPDSVGYKSRFTCVTGEIIRAIEPRYRAPDYGTLRLAFPIRTPAEVLIFDSFIHRDLFKDNERFTANLYSDLFAGGPKFRYEESDQLPFSADVTYLGNGALAGATPDIPRYNQAVQAVFDKCGVNGEDFDLYRLRLDFPPISTTILKERPLPNRP